MQQTSTAVRIPQQTRSQQTRSKLLEAGLTLFVEEGFHKTTSKDIARQAGVAVGSFYAYFQDKRAVLQELLDAFAQQSWQNQAWEPAQCDDVQAHPKQMLLRMLKQQARMHEQSRDMRDILTALAKNDPEMHSMLESWQQRSLQHTRDMLWNIQDYLIVNDFEAAVMVVNATLQENIRLVMAYSDPDIQEALLAEIADMLARYLFPAPDVSRH